MNEVGYVTPRWKVRRTRAREILEDAKKARRVTLRFLELLAIARWSPELTYTELREIVEVALLIHRNPKQVRDHLTASEVETMLEGMISEDHGYTARELRERVNRHGRLPHSDHWFEGLVRRVRVDLGASRGPGRPRRPEAA